MSLFFNIMTAAGLNDIVTVSGEGITDIQAGNARAALVFNTDGTVDKIEASTTTQIDSATDWIIPNSTAPSDYEIRFTSLVGAALDGVTNLTEDVFAILSTQRTMDQNRTTVGTDTSTFTVEIRKGSGSVLSSASYTLTASKL